MLNTLRAIIADVDSGKISPHLAESRIFIAVTKQRSKTVRLNTDQSLSVRMGTKKKVQRATANNRRLHP